MAVLGTRIKVWLVAVAMAAGLLGAWAVADQMNQGNGDRRISVENLTHKGDHHRPPGCDKGKGYANSGGKKCWKHNGGTKPGKSSNAKGKSKGKKNK